MAKSNLPKSWEEFYASFVQIPSEHGGPWNSRIKYILKLCAPLTLLWDEFTQNILLGKKIAIYF